MTVRVFSNRERGVGGGGWRNEIGITDNFHRLGLHWVARLLIDLTEE